MGPAGRWPGNVLVAHTLPPGSAARARRRACGSARVSCSAGRPASATKRSNPAGVLIVSTRHGPVSGHREGVRDAAGQHDERTRRRGPGLLAAGHRGAHPALEHVERLVLTVVQVGRRAEAGRAERLHHTRPASLVSPPAGLDGHQRVHEPDRLALPGGEVVAGRRVWLVMGTSFYGVTIE